MCLSKSNILASEKIKVEYLVIPIFLMEESNIKVYILILIKTNVFVLDKVYAK